MIGQISASNQLRTSSKLAPNMFGASSELASVMEFGFYSKVVDKFSLSTQARARTLRVLQMSRFTYLLTHTHTQTHRFNGQCPGEPRLAGCFLIFLFQPFESEPSLINGASFHGPDVKGSLMVRSLKTLGDAADTLAVV